MGIGDIMEKVEEGAGVDEPLPEGQICPVVGDPQLGLVASIMFCSGFSLVLAVLRRDRTSSALLREVLASKDSQKAVFRRAIVLAKKPIDEAYGNENDIALLAYLWALSKSNRRMAGVLAWVIMKHAKNLFWCRSMISRIQHGYEP